MSILAINAGSSSLKFGLFDGPDCAALVTGELDWADGNREEAQLIVRPRQGTIVRSRLPLPDSSSAAARVIQVALGALPPGTDPSAAINAVGHRIVHGGADYRDSIIIDSDVKEAISLASELAPLHNPPALKAIHAVEEALPGKPQVAVFDTSFHAGLPPKAFLYAVPYDWYERWGIRRFGFHGISHAYCARRAAEIMGRDPSQLRLVSCHLGGGCSATAVKGGVAVATTSGFSPMDGLMMGTRCGAIDPGILIHLQRREALTGKELDRALNHFSGLLGISGVSPDLAQIEVAATQGNNRARLAFDMFADQVRGAIGRLAATLGGIDALTFTDRVGEGSPSLRAAVCQGLDFMGICLDAKRNPEARPDTDIATPGSPARILVIHTEEELMVARETRRVARRERPVVYAEHELAATA
ncbi:MAG: acetate/propionate family kinase [Limisphaerales bacterium]